MMMPWGKEILMVIIIIIVNYSTYNQNTTTYTLAKATTETIFKQTAATQLQSLYSVQAPHKYSIKLAQHSWLGRDLSGH